MYICILIMQDFFCLSVVTKNATAFHLIKCDFQVIYKAGEKNLNVFGRETTFLLKLKLRSL